MTFPRLHLFELEDQPWLPGIVRDLATDYLCFIQATFRLYRPILPLLAEALRVTNQRQIVDLCSGGGGPVLEIQKALSAAGLNISITLTDIFHNSRPFKQIEGAPGNQITFVRESVAARPIPNHIIGPQTIFNSSPHFREPDARNILLEAEKAGHPVAFFKYPARA